MGGVEGRVALVTGGFRGIGKEIALSLARAGAAMAVGDYRDGGAAESVARDIEKFGVRGTAVLADVSNREQVQRMVREAKKALGPIDILVNNAGIFDYDYTSALALEEEMWDRMCNVNLKAVYLCCVATIPDMMANRWGRIINIASTAGITGGTSGIHYAATKGGVIALSKALAREIAACGITVNVVAPSKIDTHLFRTAVKAEDRPEVVKNIPVGRLGQPEDVAEAVLYFASEEAGYVTGQTLVVSGGY